jgi:hypothetical protein
VSIGADGTMLAVNSGNISRSNGNNTWTQMSGNTFSTPCAQVTLTSSTYIRALDTGGVVYTYDGSDPWSSEGIFDSGVKCIALASDFTFVFIDSTGTTRLVPYDPTPPAG